MVQPLVTLNNKYKVMGSILDNQRTVIRIPLDSVDATPAGEPVVLELDYRLPASFVEGKRLWQTTVYPPVLKGSLVPPRLRWQITWPTSAEVAFPWEKDLAVDFRWGWHGWLLGPEPAVASADLETWVTGAKRKVRHPLGSPCGVPDRSH